MIKSSLDFLFKLCEFVIVVTILRICRKTNIPFSGDTNVSSFMFIIYCEGFLHPKLDVALCGFLYCFVMPWICYVG